MFCYVDCYFVILSFSSVYFTSCFNKILFRFHWFMNMTTLHRNTYTHILYMHVFMYVCVCMCVVISHTVLLSYSKLSQEKLLHRNSPIQLLYPPLRNSENYSILFTFIVSLFHMLSNKAKKKLFSLRPKYCNNKTLGVWDKATARGQILTYQKSPSVYPSGLLL